MQALVNNSQLGIPSKRSKANLLGFYDCAMGEKKRLRVRYFFKGRQHELEVDDLAAVAAPLRGELAAAALGGRRTDGVSFASARGGMNERSSSRLDTYSLACVGCFSRFRSGGKKERRWEK